jgi:hypothetical protein
VSVRAEGVVGNLAFDRAVMVMTWKHCAVRGLAYPDLARHRSNDYFGSQTRVEVAAGVTYHSYNHYGQMVVYARMNGVVPPASRR